MASRILYENKLDDAVVSAGTEELLLPASNVQDPHVATAHAWHSLLGADRLVFDYGSATPLNLFAAFGVVADTMRVRASAADSSGAAGELGDWTLDVDQDYRSQIKLLEESVSPRYVRYDFTRSAGVVECARAVAGVSTTLAVGMAKGWSIQHNDRSRRRKTSGGSTQTLLDNCYRSVDLTFANLTAAERNVIEALDRSNGMHADVLLVLKDGSDNLARDCVWGLVSQQTPIVQPFPNFYSKQFLLEERS